MAEFKKASVLERLKIDLSDEEKKKLNAWIDNKKNAMSQDRTDFIDRQLKYFDNYDDFVTFGRKGPWDDAPNYHLPLTEIMVKSYHARLYNIFTSKDAMSFEPRENTDEKVVDLMKRLREWYLWDYINEYRGIKGVAKEIFWDLCTVGYGIAFKTWDIKQRKIIDIEENEFKKEMSDIEPQFKQAEEEGGEVDIKPYKEIEKVITAFEGTKIQTVPFENAYFPNNIPESNDLNHPECVIVSTDMTVSDILLKGESGIWDKEACNDIANENHAVSGSNDSNLYAESVRQKRNVLTGYNDENSAYTDQNRIIEYCFCKYDIDGDGIAEEIIVTRSSKGNIAKVIYLDRASKSGRRPLYKFDCFTKPRQAYSRGVVEYMYPLNEELDLNHNLRMASAELQAMPWGVYRGSSSLDNQEIKISPGKWVPVDDVNNDVRPMAFPSNTQGLVQSENMLWNYAERLATVSPLSSGMVPNTVGPTRSTSGVTVLLQQMEKEFRPIMDQIADEWVRLEKDILDDLDHRVSPELKARVLGPTIKDVYDNDPTSFDSGIRLTASLDVKMDVASLIRSEELKRQESSVLLQTLNAPTLLQQFGIVTPKGLYRAAEDLIRSYGKDADSYLDKPEFIPKALTLYQEIQIIAQGEVPPMSMMDDHEKKAADLEAFMQSDEYGEAKRLGLYAGSVDEVFKASIDKHMKLAEALKAQQGGGPNPTGEQGADPNALMSGQAPQQGGANPEQTTSRDLGNDQGGDVEPIEEE